MRSGRKLVDVRGNHAPGALHHELHQKRAQRDERDAGVKTPQRNDEQRADRGA